MTIPGLPDEVAFVLSSSVSAQVSALPVLIAAPHGGRIYPPAALAALRHPQAAPLRLEDRLTDRLAEEVALRTGAVLLAARAPRALIDLNRHDDDIDWGMISCVPPGRRRETGHTPGRRARGGLGLVPRRVPGLGELWSEPLDHATLVARIEQVHRPYHAALDHALGELEARWGAALLVDLHSMPPLGGPERLGPVPRVVIGDRFGAACDGRIVATAFAELAAEGVPAAHNRPYAGGYVLERHGRPNHGRHGLQLEIDRTIYLDDTLSEPGPGFEPLVGMLVRLVRRLGAIAAELGGERRRDWAVAAE